MAIRFTCGTEPLAIVGHFDSHHVVGSPHGNRRRLRYRVLDDVGQGLLHDAKNRCLHDLGKPTVPDTRCVQHHCDRVVLSHVRDQPFEGRHQSEIVEGTGPESEREPSNILQSGLSKFEQVSASLGKCRVRGAVWAVRSPDTSKDSD